MSEIGDWNLHYRTNHTTLQTFQVDGLNQLTNGNMIGRHKYDANGNLTEAHHGHRWYSYDDEHRLSAIEADEDWRTELVYDGRGRLRVRLEYGWTDGWELQEETRYVYDGWRVVQERDGGNAPTVSCTRGNDLSGSLEGAGGIGGLLARSHGYSGGTGNWSTHNFYHADGGGNVTYLVNSSQTLAASYRYDPFGNTLSSSGSLADANLYRFSSKEFHANSGLYYYGYRFYDPNAQRWPNRDPLGDQAFKRQLGIPSSRKRIDRNLYHFVWHNPVYSYDPFGLDNTPWPFNGQVCNCKDNKETVCVLIDGDYFTLPPGQCTAGGNQNGGGSDVDGYWVGDTFYKLKTGSADACKPNDKCKWDGNPRDPDHPDKTNPNSPAGRGSKTGNTFPKGCGPVYVPPPLPIPPIRTGP